MTILDNVLRVSFELGDCLRSQEALVRLQMEAKVAG